MTKPEAIDNFNFFHEGDYITREMEESKDIVLDLIKTQQEKIEYYKKQKDYDDQFKQELLETIRCKSLEIDSLNKVLDDRLIRIQGGRGLYAKLRGLDKEYLIRECLSMYKMCKEEIKNAYWKGYTVRDAEAQNICKMCKYKTEIKKLNSMLKIDDITAKCDAELVKELKAEVENKDKIIDEMASHIKTTAIYECPSKDCEDDGSITCEDCIKEYFINKVEKEDKDEYKYKM